MDTLRLASSASPMGLAQAARVGNRISTRLESLRLVEVLVETPMDSEKQIERIAEKVRDGTADAGVCPASHLGSALPAGVTLAALFRDRDPRYRCVSPERPSLGSLPFHSRVVACDPIARAQIRHRHPRLQTDLETPSWEIFAGLRHRAWDAACLPPEIFDVGSLEGLSSELIPAKELLPAVGQGVVAILARAEDLRVREWLAEIHDSEMEMTFAAERAFLLAISGKVLDSVATARAVHAGGWMELTGFLAQLDGQWLTSVEARLSLETAAEDARRLAATCRERAGKEKAGEAAMREVLVR